MGWELAPNIPPFINFSLLFTCNHVIIIMTFENIICSSSFKCILLLIQFSDFYCISLTLNIGKCWTVAAFKPRIFMLTTIFNPLVIRHTLISSLIFFSFIFSFIRKRRMGFRTKQRSIYRSQWLRSEIEIKKLILC